MGATRVGPLLLVAPALFMILALFVYPLGMSFISAFAAKDGGATLENFARVGELYAADVLFTLVIVAIAMALIGALATAIGGYLLLGENEAAVAALATAIGGYLLLGENEAAVAALKFLYRWPLFIPFIVAAQCMRTFLAKNGLMNNAIDALGLIDMRHAAGLLDWRGIIVTFVWKQAPFVTLLVAGAMASLDRAMLEAARNLGASRLRILVEIVLPQVGGVMTTGLILSFVTMLSVLSVPVMISGGAPTMMTVDMAFRISAYGDYGTANALGLISYGMTAAAAWVYLRRGVAGVR